MNLYWEQILVLRTFASEIERATHPFCNSNDITPLQVKLLVVLQQNGNQTVSALAKLTNMAGTNSSVLCKKMEKDGLVLRERDPADERQVIVALTPKGEELVAKFTKNCERMIEKMNMEITRQEAQEIARGVRTMLTVLKRIQPLEEAPE